MHPYNHNPSGSDSVHYLQIAENLLKTRDLIGTKSYALKAQESDPNSESANQILAIVDTLIAGDKQISSSNLDWYSILQLARRTHDSELIASQYKRLSKVLNPNRNRFAYAEHAFKLVTEAWMVLSNPARKFQVDNEFGNSNATHFNFIQTRFEGSEMQQRNQLIGGGSSGQFEGSEMQQGRNQLIGGSGGHFEGLEMQQGRNKQIGGGSSGHFEGLEMEQGRNKQIGGTSGGNSGVHFDFMQDGSGGEMRQGSPMQFVQQQQQQQVFGQQAISFFGEEEREEEEDEQILTSQLNWLNQGKQPLVRAQPQQELVRPQPHQHLVRPQPQQQLARPQPQQPLLRPHSQVTWFEQPEALAHIQHPLPQSQPQLLQPQPLQPSHWAQSQSQSQLNKPVPESREPSTSPLLWAQHVPQQLPPLSQPQPQWMQQALPRPHIQQSSIEPLPTPDSREQPQQPLGLSRQVPWLPPEAREQPQQPLHSSQPVPQDPPLLETQPWMQESLPSPQIQTSSPEPRSQPEKTLPESQERVNNGEHFNFGENVDDANNHDNNVNVEEPANFWTACPYCYHMYEYAGIYVDCTLRCENCKKAFHAARIEAPPAVADGEDAYISCWGYFPIGVSMSDLEKRKADASNWQPFSKMYPVPRGGNTSAAPQGGTEFAFPQGGNNTSKQRNPRNSGPRIYIDDDLEDIFDDIASNDESDDDDWRYAPKNKKARRYTRRNGSTTKKVKQPQVLAEMVQDSNTGNLHSGVVAQDGSGVSVPDAAAPIVPEEAVPIVADSAVPIVPDAAVPSVPVPKDAVDDADKKVDETSKQKVSFSIRKQPGRVAKDLGKLDGVAAQEGQGVGVPDVAAPIVSVAEADKKATGEAEKKAAGGSSKKGVSVPTRKQPGRVAKDIGS